MMAFEHDLPFLEWPVVTITLPGAAIDDLGSLLAFAVDIGTSVERILQHRDHVAITNRRPVERDQSLAIRRARKMNLIGSHRKQDLSRAAQFAESRKDLVDRLLKPEIRIEIETDLAMPDIADGNADA